MSFSICSPTLLNALYIKYGDRSFGATPGLTPYLAENRHFQTDNSQCPFDENTSNFSIS